MITLGSTLSSAREVDVVYTKPWMVELVLDLAGYLPEKRLAEAVQEQGPILRAVRENEGRMPVPGWMVHRIMIPFIRSPFAGPPGGSVPAISNPPLTTRQQALQLLA